MTELAAAYGETDWIDETAAMQMALAYIRREKWRAKLQAAEIVSLLAEAMGGGRKREQMSLGALGMLGFRVEGA